MEMSLYLSFNVLDSTYGSDTRQNQALETLRKLGVEFSEENRKAFVTKKIDISIRCGGGRAQIMSAFKFLKEEGLSLEEGMYSSCLCYLIDEKMEKKFKFLIRILKEEIPDSSPVLGYYEMLLWIELNDVQKIEEIGCGIIDRWGELSSLEGKARKFVLKGNISRYSLNSCDQICSTLSGSTLCCK